MNMGSYFHKYIFCPCWWSCQECSKQHLLLLVAIHSVPIAEAVVGMQQRMVAGY